MPLNYTASIRAIEIAHTLYQQACDRAECDDVIDAALDALHKAKAAHLGRFQFLKRVGGEWI